MSLFDNLDEERFDKYLIYGSSKDFSPLFYKIKDTYSDKLIYIPSLVRCINPLKDIFALSSLLKVFKKEKFSIVHTHTSKAGFLGRLAAKFSHTPIIIHSPHGHVFYGYFNCALSSLIVLIERFLAKFSDCIITLTEAGKDDHIRYKVEKADKFVPIYCGIDLERFLNTEIDSLKLKEKLGIKDEFVVATVSRLEPVKGVEYFIRAAKLISDRLRNVKFIVVGDGSLRERLVKLTAKLDLTDKFIFLGHREDTNELLQIFDVFVTTALNEGLGRAILEAFASQVCVVATAVGGVLSIVKSRETGILCESKNYSQIAKAVIELLENKELRNQLTKKALEDAKVRFSQETMLKETFALYDKLIESKL